jgi:hypothetical protein
LAFFQAAGASGKYLVSGSSSETLPSSKHHDRGGGELLPIRSGLKKIVSGFTGHLQFDIRQAVALLLDGLAVANDEQG